LVVGIEGVHGCLVQSKVYQATLAPVGQHCARSGGVHQVGARSVEHADYFRLVVADQSLLSIEPVGECGEQDLTWDCISQDPVIDAAAPCG
jgi:hypothetical protein